VIAHYLPYIVSSDAYLNFELNNFILIEFLNNNEVTNSLYLEVNFFSVQN
jgi:hypothetical protein